MFDEIYVSPLFRVVDWEKDDGSHFAAYVMKNGLVETVSCVDRENYLRFGAKYTFWNEWAKIHRNFGAKDNVMPLHITEKPLDTNKNKHMPHVSYVSIEE